MTTAVPIAVYLNQARGSFLGFHDSLEPPALHKVLTFDLGIEPGQYHGAAIPDALERVWAQLNIDTPTTAWGRQYRAAGHRSLSVGDVLVVGETAWAVASVGFDQLSADHLASAIVA